MNLSLFRSIHVLTAAVLVGGFALWRWDQGIEFGRQAGSDPGFLLSTGWVAFALYIVLALYALRKSAHRTRITPEFKMRVSIDRLEKAEARLAELRVRILSGELSMRREIIRNSKRILREEGVARVIRVRVEPGPQPGPRYRMLVRPREPLGRLAAWMHVHIYMGFAAAGMVWFHGGGNIASPMGLVLNGLSLLVIATGVFGIVVWTFGPTWLTRCEKDLSLEKAFSLREHYRKKIHQQAASLRDVFAGDDVDGRIVDQLLALQPGVQMLARARPALAGLPETGARRGAQDLLVLMGQGSNVESEWRRLRRVWLGLHIWRAVHVPASILLLTAVVAHVLSVAWY